MFCIDNISQFRRAVRNRLDSLESCRTVMLFQPDFYFYLLSVFTTGFCNEVCYGDLGCFDTTLNCHRDFFPPLPPADINTYYVIHTRKTEGIPQAVVRANATLEAMVDVVGERRVSFIIHGWGEGIWKQWILDLRDALLEKVSYRTVHILVEKKLLSCSLCDQITPNKGRPLLS